MWLLKSSKELLCYCQTEYICDIFSYHSFVFIFLNSHIFIFTLFFLFPFLFIPMPCPNFIGQFVSYHNPSWSSVKKLHGRFWDASSFSSGNLAPLTRVLRRPNREACLSLSIGTWVPPLSIFYRILS